MEGSQQSFLKHPVNMAVNRLTKLECECHRLLEEHQVKYENNQSTPEAIRLTYMVEAPMVEVN
jgi:hypothetical protein